MIVTAELRGRRMSQVNDLLNIEGDEKGVRRHLDRCDPDWTALNLAER